MDTGKNQAKHRILSFKNNWIYLDLILKLILKKNFKKLIHCLKLKFRIAIYVKPDGVNLWYFILWLFDLTKFMIWNIQCLGLQIYRNEFLAKTQFLLGFLHSVRRKNAKNVVCFALKLKMRKLKKIEYFFKH